MTEESKLPSLVDDQPIQRKTPLTAGNLPRAIVPIDFEGAYRIANVVTQAGMAPKTLQTVEKAMVAILHGLEVGLTPMNALQAIAVINGRPTIWGDGAIGLIRASGLLEYMEEFYENEDDPIKMKAVCVVKRKGEPKPVKTDFSMADAKKAGLLAKEGPWQTYPKRMLKMRARWALRDTFADVLKGLQIREEVEDMDRQEAQQAPRHRVAPPPPRHQEAVSETKPAEEIRPYLIAPEEMEEASSWGDRFKAMLNHAKTPEEVDAWYAANQRIFEKFGANEGYKPLYQSLVDAMDARVLAITGQKPAQTTAPADSGFPGDKPMKMIDAGEIPPALRRAPAPPETTRKQEDADWLRDLDADYAECGAIDELSFVQNSNMMPWKEHVSADVWKEAMDITAKHIKRIEQAHG